MLIVAPVVVVLEPDNDISRGKVPCPNRRLPLPSAVPGGLPEATDQNGESFGYERLTTLVENAPTPDLALERILKSFDRHLGGRALEDDFSLVTVGRDVPLPPLPELS